MNRIIESEAERNMIDKLKELQNKYKCNKPEDLIKERIIKLQENKPKDLNIKTWKELVVNMREMGTIT